MVENFALPQKVAKSANPIIYTMQEWLSAYGDPEYILFYEKFHEDEARYWHAGAYRTGFLAILGTEAVFLGIDAVTLGLGGKVLKPIAGGIAKIIPGSAIVSEGVIAIKNDRELFDKCRTYVVPYEGFPTYGGLNGRDMDALAVGLMEALDIRYLTHRIDQVRYLGDRLHEAVTFSMRASNSFSILSQE